MFIRQFPDLKWLKAKIDARFADRKGWKDASLPSDGWPTLILNAQATSEYRDDIRGPFSVFLNLKGNSFLKADGKEAAINEDFFFVTNRDQYYTLEIDSEQPTETFNLHFGDHFAEQAIQSIVQSPRNLLENPFDPDGPPIGFFNRTYPRDPHFNQLIQALRTTESSNQTSVEGAQLRREELMYGLFLHLVDLTHTDHQRFERLPLIRQTTREEITKRLLLAVDYIHSYFSRPLSLDELAAVSCLSKFHFLRLFKLAFSQTPYQYLKKVRIERAVRLLKGTQLPVHLIAEQVGFENSNSLSRAVVQQTGFSPSIIRTEAQDSLSSFFPAHTSSIYSI